MSRYLILSMVLAGCVTVSTPTPELTVKSVKIGDRLYLTVENYTDCYMEVGNIITLEATGVGWMPAERPEVCGPITCKVDKPTIDQKQSYCTVFSDFIKPKKEGNNP